MARTIEDVETDILIVDPIGPILGANRIDENSPNVRFITGALDQLKLEAGVSSMIVVAHNGKNDDKGTRGHSSLEDWPDVIWQYKLSDHQDQDSPRVLDVYGRTDPVQRELIYDRPNRRLSTSEVLFSETDKARAILVAMRDMADALPASARQIHKQAKEHGYPSNLTAITTDLRMLNAEEVVTFDGKHWGLK